MLRIPLLRGTGVSVATEFQKSVATLNVPVAKEVLTQIEANRRNFDMSAWIQNRFGRKRGNPIYDKRDVKCETKACLAGWVALLDPGVERINGGHGTVEFVDGTEIGIVSYAAERLGMDYYEADSLFYACGDDDAALGAFRGLIAAAGGLST